jgi:alanine racemase
VNADYADASKLDLTGLRATRAIVDLDAIAGNVRAVRGIVPSTTKLMAVVKADAYGHGAVWVAAAALEAGAALLGVATVGEGATLRAAGIEAPIVLLGSIEPGEAAAACQARLEVTVADEVLLDAVQGATRGGRLLEPVGVHLKIDTGLRRYGAPLETVPALAARIAGDPNLRFAGLCTHFASADEPDEPFTAQQLGWFEAAAASLRAAGLNVPARHVANSAGILTGQGADHEIVRLGISLYGVPPSDQVALPPGMRPALRIESRIARLIEIAPGDTVGYNRTYRAPTATRGALVPIGYADGYRRAYAGGAWVGLHGRRAPLLGRVSMDQLVVEVPAGVAARAGDRVEIMGTDPASGAPLVADLARLADTNAYEVLVGIRSRVPRVFVRGEQVVGVRTGVVERGQLATG